MNKKDILSRIGVIEAPPGIAESAAYVNAADDRYRALVKAVVFLFAEVKLPREAKQFVLADVSDLLDGIVPSGPHSGRSR